jgi:hypothetical protein
MPKRILVLVLATFIASCVTSSEVAHLEVRVSINRESGCEVAGLPAYDARTQSILTRTAWEDDDAEVTVVSELTRAGAKTHEWSTADSADCAELVDRARAFVPFDAVSPIRRTDGSTVFASHDFEATWVESDIPEESTLLLRAGGRSVDSSASELTEGGGEVLESVYVSPAGDLAVLQFWGCWCECGSHQEVVRMDVM